MPFPTPDQLDQVIIEVVVPDYRIPISSTSINKSQIELLNQGQDVPYLLRTTPSVTVTSDAGNGIGYTGIWIRGTDPSRINVTINGVPLNDPESQQVFWVDVPDLASSAFDINVERGAGSSTNGSGSFGGAVKIETRQIHYTPFAQLTQSFGSFNTRKHTLQFGTGLIQNQLTFDGRVSNIASEGYIDRAKSNLKSYYFHTGFRGQNNDLDFLVFGGNENTYQSWYGTPASRLTGNTNEMLEYASRNGLDEEETQNLLSSGRTYNYYTYENQIDDYTQNHFQGMWRQKINHRSRIVLTGFYVRGYGYFEEFKKNQQLEQYGLDNILIHDQVLFSDHFDNNGSPYNAEFESYYGDQNINIDYTQILDNSGNPVIDSSGNYLLNAQAAIVATDLVRRRGLDNHFYGSHFTYNRIHKSTDISLRAGINQYDGEHYGEFVWSQFASNSMPGDRYYTGRSNKTDGNVSATIRTGSSIMQYFADVQWRQVHYSTSGTNNDLVPYDVRENLGYLNARIGTSIRLWNTYRGFVSLAYCGHEPNRNDFVDAIPGTKPGSEYMIDFEASLLYRQEKWNVRGTLYHMQYKDQLVLTGELNDSGAPLRQNAADSYRQGIELEWQYKAFREKLNWQANITLANNKISSFEESVYDYTEGLSIQNIQHSNTTISFSPSVIGSSTLSWKLFENRSHAMSVNLISRYTGKQFLDNTSSSNRQLDPFAVNDFIVHWTKRPSWSEELKISLAVNNLFDEKYSSNGYTYSYIYGEKVTENFYYPQAGINLMATIAVKI